MVIKLCSKLFISIIAAGLLCTLSETKCNSTLTRKKSGQLLAVSTVRKVPSTPETRTVLTGRRRYWQSDKS